MRTRKILITPELWAEAERIRREGERAGTYNVVSSCVVSQGIRKQWRKGRPRANKDNVGYFPRQGCDPVYNPADNESRALLASVVRTFDNRIPYPFVSDSVTIRVKKARY